jgi:hypothetical protein
VTKDIVYKITNDSKKKIPHKCTVANQIAIKHHTGFVMHKAMKQI